jgi:hypothetical protein
MARLKPRTPAKRAAAAPPPPPPPDPEDVFKKVKACVLRFFRPPGQSTKPYGPGVKPSDKMGAQDWDTMAKKIAGCIKQAIPKAKKDEIITTLRRGHGKMRSEFIEDVKDKIVEGK